MPTCDETEYWDGTKCCPRFNEVLGSMNTNFVATITTDPEKIKEVTKFILDTIEKFQKKYPPGDVVKSLERKP